MIYPVENQKKTFSGHDCVVFLEPPLWENLFSALKGAGAFLFFLFKNLHHELESFLLNLCSRLLDSWFHEGVCTETLCFSGSSGPGDAEFPRPMLRWWSLLFCSHVIFSLTGCKAHRMSCRRSSWKSGHPGTFRLDCVALRQYRLLIIFSLGYEYHLILCPCVHCALAWEDILLSFKRGSLMSAKQERWWASFWRRTVTAKPLVIKKGQNNSAFQSHLVLSLMIRTFFQRHFRWCKLQGKMLLSH